MSKRCSSSTETEPQEQCVRPKFSPIRRIAQACDNCRRRKARCTGERPKCSNCARLFKDCSYTSTCNHSSDPTPPSKVNRNDWEEMTQRLDNVELRLASIHNKLERLLERPRAPYTPVVSDTGIIESLEGRRVGRQVTSDIEEPSYPMLSLQERMKAQTSFPPFEVKLALIDLYFTHCHNNPYSLFHERQFRHNFHSGQLKNHLLLAVMASAARFADIAMLGRDPLEMAVYLADYAWQIASLDCFSSSMDTDIITVQTMALLALFDFTAGPERHNSAWVKIGLAVRLAQDLHLMEEPDATLPASEKEEHRRTFWSIYLLERLVSCGRYRPPAILDCTFLLQLPCNEQAWHSNVEEQTPTLNDFCNHRIPGNRNLGPFAMVIMAASLLSRCAQYALQKQPIASDEPPWHPKSGHAAIVSSMMFLEEQLQLGEPLERLLQKHAYSDGVFDKSLSAPLIFSRLLYHLCRCLLYHPFLLREQAISSRDNIPSVFWSHSKNTCMEASDEIINLVQQASEAGCTPTACFSGYCVAIAATVQALQTTGEIVLGISLAAERLQKCIEHLEKLGQHWHSATVMKMKLQQFTHRILNFCCLVDGNILRSPIEAADQEFLWDLMDYSTLSKTHSVATLGNFDGAVLGAGSRDLFNLT